MNNQKHTPGPWQLAFIKGDIDICIGVQTIPENGYSQMIVNTILPNTDKEYLKEREELEANAKLISAAPDLLEVCILLDELKNKILPFAETPHFEDAHDLITKAKAAIKKATK